MEFDAEHGQAAFSFEFLPSIAISESKGTPHRPGGSRGFQWRDADQHLKLRDDFFLVAIHNANVVQRDVVREISRV